MVSSGRADVEQWQSSTEKQQRSSSRAVQRSSGGVAVEQSKEAAAGERLELSCSINVSVVWHQSGGRVAVEYHQ